jgi:cytidylate kinase
LSTIIAIDGPAGAGKSTIAREIARNLSFAYFDSGAVYRVFTLFLLGKFGKIDEEKEYSAELEKCISGLELEFSHNERKIILFGKDVTKELREENITREINKIANQGQYRQKANWIIRKYAQLHDMVIDGRDIGTEIFPDTPFKFFLDATIETRALRRYKEQNEFPESNQGLMEERFPLKRISEDIIKRDFLDKNREVGPLKQAPDAIYINSDNLSIEKVVQFFLEKILKIKESLY